MVEGVPYHRYLVRYTTSAGKRRQKVLYAPGRAFLRDTIDRWVYLDDVDIKPGSNVIVKGD